MVDKYTYRIEWSEEDQAVIAKCLEFPGRLEHGTTNEGPVKEIKVVVSESVKWLTEKKEEVPSALGLKKFKGKLTLRVSPEIHRKLAIKSAEEGVSVNQYILSRL